MRAIDFLRHVLDPHRLAVVGLVAAGPATVEEIAERARLRSRDVLEALAPLVAAGIVERDGDRYALRPGGLRELSRDLPTREPPAQVVFAGMTQEEADVLARFFRGKRLVEVPAQRTKRRIVLERIALDFEPGVYYPEREVNAMLSAYHADHAALRRYLVDEGYLQRGEGKYWRTGGRV